MSSATDSTTDAKSPGYPEGERAIRTDLAACYRLAAHFRMTDITYTHISARLEGEEAFLLNAFGLLFEEVRASNLVKVDESAGSSVIRPGSVSTPPGLSFTAQFTWAAPMSAA